MSKVYSSSKPKSPKEPEIRSTKVEAHHGNGKVERIQHRAYEIYQQRLQNQMPGDMISDWVAAEQEVNARETEGNQRDCQQNFCKIGGEGEKWDVGARLKAGAFPETEKLRLLRVRLEDFG